MDDKWRQGKDHICKNFSFFKNLSRLFQLFLHHLLFGPTLKRKLFKILKFKKYLWYHWISCKVCRYNIVSLPKRSLKTMKYISMRYGNTSLENEHLGPEKSCSFQIYQLKKNTCDSRKCRRPEKNLLKFLHHC